MISHPVSALADSALLLPASVIVAAYLAVLGRWRLAGAWCLALALSGGATIAAKLLFKACGHEITVYDVVSPSGHASFATVFYGCLALLVGRGRPAAFRRVLAVATALFVVGVCVSRVRTAVHTPLETVIGVGIGAAAVAVFWALHARERGRPVPLVPVAIGFGVLVVLLGGLHLSFEDQIGGVARRVSAALDVCAKTRPMGAPWFPRPAE